MIPSHELREDDRQTSPRFDAALSALRDDFRSAQSNAVDSAMHRVRQEAELKNRMHASVRESQGFGAVAWRRAGFAAAACAAIASAATIGFVRFAQDNATARLAAVQPEPGVKVSVAALAQAPEERSLSARIAEARPGETLVLAKSTILQATDAPLRIAKQVRIVVEDGSAKVN